MKRKQRINQQKIVLFLLHCVRWNKKFLCRHNFYWYESFVASFVHKHRFIFIRSTKFYSKSSKILKIDDIPFSFENWISKCYRPIIKHSRLYCNWLELVLFTIHETHWQMVESNNCIVFIGKCLYSRTRSFIITSIWINKLSTDSSHKQTAGNIHN